MNIGIIGIGHIGSSLALALRTIGKYDKIYGYDIDEKSIKYANDNNIYDGIVSFEEIQKNDIIFIATNITAIISIINSFEHISQDTIIVDLGSTKKSIIQNIPKKIRDNYIPTHPMAGKEYSGIFHADEKLFDDKTIIICDQEKSNPQKLASMIDVFNDLNMNIIYMDSNEHDEHASYVSHMPHIISFSLANSVLNHEKAENITSLAGGGFNDISRIAKSSPIMWVDIFKNNKDNLIKSLDEFENEFKTAKKMIEDENWDSLNKWIAHANHLQHIL